MASLDTADPTVSATVELAGAEEREAAGQPGLHDNQATAQLKTALTKAGFEVHAPFATSFSIGARQSLFEEYFAQKLVVEDGLISTVTVEGGDQRLPLDALPDDVRPFVRSVTFVSPPSFHELTAKPARS
ncbi:MAG: hypothetical protein ABR511_01830 [Acidimicrobiales bacterium]